MNRVILFVEKYNEMRHEKKKSMIKSVWELIKDVDQSHSSLKT